MLGDDDIKFEVTENFFVRRMESECCPLRGWETKDQKNV